MATDADDPSTKPLLRALLLTDAVDSTKLTQTLGDAAMAQHWAVHDRAARDLLPAWRGREIDKTDGMLLLFERAEDAVGYAMAYHRALAATSLPFKARAGIHVGEVVLRANPADDVARGAKPVEVDGIALPVTARVMSVALGGQTLLTGDARIALGITKLRLQTHGHWRLHGLADPMELFEVGEKDAPFTPPHDEAKAYRVARIGDLWQPVREVKHSVPAERDSFVGRQEPLQVLAKKLEDGARLVSVLGMGGTGKTRLVTRFAWMWLGEFPGGVWFCDLSQARTVDGIYFAVAQGLDVPLGKTDSVVQLGHAINGRGKCLVILDNFEQVARFAEETAGRWLERAPLARFIVTSRGVLGIIGEEVLALAPLPAPDAATLFIRRAGAVRQDYRPSEEDQATIGQLVKALDGLPLAIELAAARVRIMPPRMLLARMSDRFKLLWSHAGRHDRQATLRAAFDWSWDLLSAGEMATLAQLSVFVGGFTLESVEGVVALPTDAAWVVDILHSLLDKSLVRQVADDRFDLLDSVREYAAEHLRTSGRFPGSGSGALLSTEQRHATFFRFIGPQRAIEHRGAELDNLVVACRRATARGEGEVAAQVLAGAWGGLKLRGPFRVAIELAAGVRAIPGLPARELVVVNCIGARASMSVGRMSDARAQLEAAITLAIDTDDQLGQVRALGNLGELHVHEGRIADARRCYSQSLVGARALSHRSFECDALSGLGSCHEYSGEIDDAQQHFEAALLIARGADDRRWQGGALGNLGQLHANQGRHEEAGRCYEEAVRIARELGDRQWEGNVCCNLGLLHHSQGRMDEAQLQLGAALTIARELGHTRLESVVLCNLGIVQFALGQVADAQRSYEDALHIARELRDRRSEGQFLGYLGTLHARAGRLEEARHCVQLGASLLRDVSDQLSLGLVLCAMVEVEQRSGHQDTAIAALEEAEALAVHFEARPGSEFGIVLGQARVLAATRSGG